MPKTDTALDQLAAQRDVINEHIAAYFASPDAALSVPLTEHGKTALAKLEEFSQRPGKRVRGALANYSYKLFGGQHESVGLDLAVAAELVQNYLLIVDDVMDRSDIRRGGPTIHEQYASELSSMQNTTSIAHIGNMLAVNIGIVALHMASDILARTPEEPSRVLSATSYLHQNIAATAYGQIEDLFSDVLQNISEGDVHTVHTLKNSYYTFINPMQTGAALAGRAGKLYDEIHAYGIPAGVAFQLQDDVIGLFGDPTKSGKSAMDDVREGKMTLLVIQALEHGTPAQQKVIHAALGNPALTEKQHAQVKDIVEAVGSLAYVQDKTKQQVAEAKAALDASQQIPSEGKDFLVELVEYVAERSK